MTEKKKTLSVMMQHYLSVKERYPDCIIFYRLGDFYEMFFEDAKKASAILDLTLTGRDCGLDERAPMCGVPFHAADVYINKLVSAGEKVAICEQLTEPNGKGLVLRDVIRVVTAGTITNDAAIEDKNNNFICSVYIGKDESAVSWADITTGEFYASNVIPFNKEIVLGLLTKISPAEIICNQEAHKIFASTNLITVGILPKFSQHLNSDFEKIIAVETLRKQFNVASLKQYGIDDSDACVAAAGALLSYLKATQMHTLANIDDIKIVGTENSLMLDVNTTRNLELIKTLRDGKKYGSLLWLLDKTKTAMGARMLQSCILSPFNEVSKIVDRQNGVEYFYKNTVARQTIGELLTQFKDLARIAGKISNNNLLPRDCLNLATTLSVLPSIKFALSGVGVSVIEKINTKITDFGDICELLNSAISNKENDLDGDYIKYGFDKELDELKEISKNSKNIISGIELKEREKTGIRNLKIGYNRVFGYYIEITNSFKDKVPYEYQRKQTLVNCERYVTDELKNVELSILTAEEKIGKLELKLYNDIKDTLRGKIDELKATSSAIAELDLILSFATVARERNYVKPIILPSENALNIVEGRHPVVEATSKTQFIPNDCLLDCNENRMSIITGPNMAGKSTYMRQIALITLMAHLGSFVPAKHAEIPITDKIFTRIGASDSLISDQSTFMVEMNETAYILKNATKNSLIILDEIGRGTSTFDGLSIAWAVVEYIVSEKQAKTLFATHYHELTELEGSLPGVKNYRVTVKEFDGNVIFLRKIMRGGANKSFGIEVAKLAGIEKCVLDRAKQILNSLEQNTEKKSNQNTAVSEKQKTSVVERIIKDLDIDNLSPMQALNVLFDLKEKIS